MNFHIVTQTEVEENRELYNLQKIRKVVSEYVQKINNALFQSGTFIAYFDLEFCLNYDLSLIDPNEKETLMEKLNKNNIKIAIVEECMGSRKVKVYYDNTK